MPIFNKNRQNLQSAKTDKSQQILQDKTTENHPIFCQNLENAVEPKTKKSAFFATKKSTPINKKHAQKNLTSNQTPTPASRKKFLKIFAAASLALITCATTLLATTPLGTGVASAATNSNLSNTTQTTTNNGLITPQEDDPVVFTTDYGIEIKWGNALTGNLLGFPYFTTNDGSINYDWVIIGVSEQPTIGEVDFLTFFESNSPAGFATLIDSSSASNKVTKINTSPELLFGELLCLSNDIIETGVYNNTETKASGFNSCAGTYKGAENIKTRMTEYYTGNLLGLGKIKQYIQPKTLNTYTYYNTTSSTSSYTYYTNTVYDQYIYPLGVHANSTFYYANYLELSEMALDTNQCVRGNLKDFNGVSGVVYINASGALAGMGAGSSAGYRPAFVMKLI